ncbi:MAG TPA: hypothetical protein VJL84_09745, partial [Kiloniellales bacterium]|nr:hypothetical protein [Kiloniellales bacterium]
MAAAWPRVMLDAWWLGMEATGVMALRTLALAAGDARAQREAGRMVSEKALAAVELQMLALRGALGFTAPATARKVLAHYRPKVR